MECGLLCHLTDICRLLPVFNGLYVNEFKNMWTIVALHFFVSLLKIMSVWLIRVERAVWALIKLDFTAKMHSRTIFCFCGSGKVMMWSE